jgi:hypothetical protein
MVSVVLWLALAQDDAGRCDESLLAVPEETSSGRTMVLSALLADRATLPPRLDR